MHSTFLLSFMSWLLSSESCCLHAALQYPWIGDLGSAAQMNSFQVCFCVADVVVNIPAEQKVLVKSDNGKEYAITLLNGKLDVNALKEQFDLEGLALTMLDGIPIYDTYGLSGHMFNGDIKAETTLKPGEVNCLVYCSVCTMTGLAMPSSAAHSNCTTDVCACNVSHIMSTHIMSTNILSACRNEVYKSISR